jgi:predicted ester cyclase
VALREVIGADMGSQVGRAKSSPTATELMRKAFEAIAAQDVDGLGSLWDERTVDVFVALGLEVVGSTDLRAFFEQLFAAVPDLVFVVEEILEVDEAVAVGQWQLTGTFSGGPFQGIEPTGRRVALRGVDVMRFDGAILRRNDIYYDGLSFARQVGMLPPADSAADRGITAAFNTLTRARRRVRAWVDR